MYSFLSQPPQEQEVLCPVCGARLGWADDIVLQRCCCEVVGCSSCLVQRNASEWAYEQL